MATSEVQVEDSDLDMAEWSGSEHDPEEKELRDACKATSAEGKQQKAKSIEAKRRLLQHREAKRKQRAEKEKEEASKRLAAGKVSSKRT